MMSKSPRYTALASSLPSSIPFVAPEKTERDTGADFRARLGANENVFGASSKVAEALTAAVSEIWKYPDPEAFDLRTALTAHLGVAMENLTVGGGIDGLLGVLVRLMIEQGDAVVTSLGAYPTFNYHVAAAGGVLHTVPFIGDYEDLDGLISAAIATNAKLIYISNPDNPMGTYHSADVIADMIARVPDGCLLILDEAYIETAPSDAQLPFDLNTQNVIRMRTFSKAYGLAGQRVGYAIGHAGLIQSFDKIRDHFGVSKLSQVAALAALQDQEYLAHVISQIDVGRKRLYQIAHENGLTTIPSATNFVSIDCGRDGDYARLVLAHLNDQGIFARMPGVAPLDRCIRISVGTPKDLDLFAEALPMALSTNL